MSYLLVAVDVLWEVIGNFLKREELKIVMWRTSACAKVIEIEHSEHRKAKFLHYSKMANPVKNPETIRHKPYTWPILIIATCAAPPLGFPVCAEPSPRPVYTTPLPPVLLAVALIVGMAELFGGRGL